MAQSKAAVLKKIMAKKKKLPPLPLPPITPPAPMGRGMPPLGGAVPMGGGMPPQQPPMGM